eukprot:gene5310-8928_t
MKTRRNRVNVPHLLNSSTTKPLSNKDYLHMGLKILVFHLDCYDCSCCQNVHQKLNKLNEEFASQGYILLLYYDRKDQDLFRVFRKEFENVMDYFVLNDFDQEFKIGSKCNSKIIQINENAMSHTYTHDDLENSFPAILQYFNIEEEVIEEDLEDRLSIDSVSSSETGEVYLSSLLDDKKKVRKSVSLPFQNKKPSFLKRLSNRVLSPRSSTNSLLTPIGSKSPKSPDSFDSKFEEDYKFEKEITKEKEILVEHIGIKESLEMGLKVVLFHMDNLKCSHCLQFHKELNQNVDLLLGEMITPALNYCRSDQNMFQMLNDFEKNKIEIIELSNISEQPLSDFGKCKASVLVLLDGSNCIQLSHDEISMYSIAKTCGFEIRDSKKLKLNQQKIQHEFEPTTPKKIGGFKKIFKRESSRSPQSSEDHPLDELTPRYITHNMTLEDVVRDEKMKNNFMNFLKKENAEENLLFYLDVQKYKSLGWTERREFSKTIVKNFLEPFGKLELNISATLKNQVIERLIYGQKDVFDEVLNNSISMMRFDVLKRFLETQSY